MRYFFDTEFIERGHQYPIELISIGIVAEDGREFYMISDEFDPDHASEWVKENVLKKLGTGIAFKLADIALAIRVFCDPQAYGKPEFWAYYADYDWVVLCQTFGTMMELPEGWPMYCRDIKQFADDLKQDKLPEQGKGEHNSLADAHWNQTAYKFLESNKAWR